MQSIKAILHSFNPSEDKYISREFQKYGYDLSEEMEDFKHKSLYIKLAKTVPRPMLEKARNFVKDAGNVRSKPRLFMWKLGQLRREWNEKRQSRGENIKPKASDLKQIHILVSGNVIGVGFRTWVFALATRNGLVGWVKNTADRKVEILLEGVNNAVNNVAVTLEKGPVTARVTDTIFKEGSYSGRYKTFEIL